MALLLVEGFYFTHLLIKVLVVVVLKMDWSLRGLAPSPAAHILLEMHTTHTHTHTHTTT